MLIYVTIVTTLFVAIDGFATLNLRIAGGEVDTIESHPYVVSITDGRKHGCVGVIISRNIGLTAGHCAPPKYTKIRAGSSFSEKYGTEYLVDSTIVHENYKLLKNPITNGTYALNDIAVFKVKTPFVFSDKIAPISMFNAGQKIAPGSNGIIVGWGNVPETEKVNMASEDLQFNQLRSVVTPIIETSICAKRQAKSNHILNPGEICAGGNGKSACFRDSGGPLIVEGKLAGIVSWGYTPCEKVGIPPTIYTDVAYFRNWIDERAKKLTDVYDFLDERPIWK